MAEYTFAYNIWKQIGKTCRKAFYTEPEHYTQNFIRTENHTIGCSKKYARKELIGNRDFEHIPQTTLEAVVNWVDILLKTRLYHLWSDKQLREQLCKTVENGGAGLSEDKIPDSPSLIFKSTNNEISK